MGLSSSSIRRPRPAPAARRRLAAREHDLVDVQEPVAVEADVDERRLHARKHVVDDALVDVAHYGPLATPLHIELGDLEVTTIARRLLRSASAGGAVTAGTGLAATSGGALAFEHRDAGLARVH